MRKIAAAIFLGFISVGWPAQVMADDDYSAPLVLAMDSGAQGVPYLSGGVGEAEREQILARENDFNLTFLFAEKSGAYLVDVRLVILTSSGQTVLALDSAGPFLLTKLPPGRYQVQATANNQRQRLTVQIGQKTRVTRVVHW